MLLSWLSYYIISLICSLLVVDVIGKSTNRLNSRSVSIFLTPLMSAAIEKLETYPRLSQLVFGR